MLAALETALAQALQKAFSAKEAILVGPQMGPSASEPAGVGVWAASLEVAHPAALSEPGPLPRLPAYRVTLVPAKPPTQSGGKAGYTVPEVGAGKVVEVQSPLGKVLELGYDYMLEGDTIHFKHPPTDQVWARVQAEQMGGFAQEQRVVVQVQVAAWAKSTPSSSLPPQWEEHFSTALAVVLQHLEPPYLWATHSAYPPGKKAQSTQVEYRLKEPVARLERVERLGVDIGGKPYVTAVAHVRVDARLSTQIGWGQPEPVSAIEQVIHEETLLKEG